MKEMFSSFYWGHNFLENMRYNDVLAHRACILALNGETEQDVRTPPENFQPSNFFKRKVFLWKNTLICAFLAFLKENMLLFTISKFFNFFLKNPKFWSKKAFLGRITLLYPFFIKFATFFQLFRKQYWFKKPNFFFHFRNPIFVHIWKT